MQKRLASRAAISAGLFALCGCAFWFLSSAGVARAQDSPAPAPIANVAAIPELRVGGSVDGDIDATDPAILGRRYEEYRITLAANELISIEMESRPGATADAPPLDTYLEIVRPGETRAMLANNDIRLGRLNSRLVVLIPERGEYLIRASGNRGRRGPYRLSVRALPKVSRPPTAMTSPSAPINIDDSSPIAALRGRGYRFAEYTFAGNTGNRVWIRGADPRPSMRFLLFDAAGAAVGGSNEIGGTGSSQILIVLPRSGTYLVRAQVPMDETVSGSIQVEQAREAVGGAVPELQAGAAVAGSLTLDSGVALEEDSPDIEYFYRMYTLRVAAGETVTVDMSSEAFDSVLEAGTPSVLGFASAVEDDDSGGDANARLVLHPEADGIVHIRARSLSPNLGAFRLQITR